MSTSNSNLLLGPVTRPLLKLATPMIVAFSFQTSFNFVDRYFVSRLGDVATAAIGMAFIIQLVVIALGSGIGMGLNSYIARNLGAGRRQMAEQAALHSFLISVVIGLAVTLIGFLGYRSIYQALGARGELLESIGGYLEILFCFAPVYLLGMVTNNIFRGWGDTVFPMKFMLTATLLNVILDPVLIFGFWVVPALGIEGAALATGLSRICALAYTLFILFKKARPVRLNFRLFQFNWNAIQGIFQVGLPAAIGQILTSVSISLIFLIIREFGDEARAAYTIAFTYEMVAFLPVIGIGQAITIMTGHNYGANQLQRIRTIYFTALKIAVGMTLPASLIVSLAPDFFAGLFARSPEVLLVSRQALRILAPGYLLAGIFICTVSSFQGLGLGRYHLIATLLRMFGFILPLAYLGSLIWELQGVWIGILCANLALAVLMMFWYRHLYLHKIITGRIQTL